MSLNDLAVLYQAQRRYEEAESLFKEALAMFRAGHPVSEFPSGHPKIAQSLTELARLYVSQQRYGEAELLHQEALAMRRAVCTRSQSSLRS